MIYRLVVRLPFDCILVHKQIFGSLQAARDYEQHDYPEGNMEVWTAEDLRDYKGEVIYFPLN